MIACTSPFGTMRFTPLRIMVSSSAIFTCKFRISSISTSLLEAPSGAHFQHLPGSRVCGAGILSIPLRSPVAIERSACRPLRFLLASLELLHHRHERAQIRSICSGGLPHSRQLRACFRGFELQGIGCCFGFEPSLLKQGNFRRHPFVSSAYNRGLALVPIAP